MFMSLTIKTLPKTLAITSLLLSLSSPLAVMAGGYEAPAPMPVVAQDTAHFYLGLQLGMGLVDGQYRARATVEDPDEGGDLVYQRWHTAFGGSSVLVGAVLGVDTIFSNDVYGALELNATYDSYGRSILAFRGPATDDPDSSSDFRIRVKNNFLYGLTAKLGKDMGGYIPYITAGVEAGRWQTSVWDGGDPVLALFLPVLDNPVDIDAPTHVHFSKTRWAPTAGLGVRFKIVDNWQGDLQYRYSWFGNLKHHQAAQYTFGEGDDAITFDAEVKHRITPNQGKAIISLNYYFDTV